MPKTPIDYSKIVIYKIVCNDLTVTDLYVGSTTDFRKRKCAHKSRCDNANGSHYNLKIYTIIRANGGWSNWTMVEIEKYTTCLDGNEARARERYWLELLNANMNMVIPSRSKKEYKIINKEYKIINKDKIKEYNKEYNKANRDKINTRQRELRKLKNQDQKQ